MTIQMHLPAGLALSLAARIGFASASRTDFPVLINLPAGIVVSGIRPPRAPRNGREASRQAGRLAGWLAGRLAGRQAA